MYNCCCLPHRVVSPNGFSISIVKSFGTVLFFKLRFRINDVTGCCVDCFSEFFTPPNFLPKSQYTHEIDVCISKDHVVIIDNHKNVRMFQLHLPVLEDAASVVVALRDAFDSLIFVFTCLDDLFVSDLLAVKPSGFEV